MNLYLVNDHFYKVAPTWGDCIEMCSAPIKKIELIYSNVDTWDQYVKNVKGLRRELS
jgi:hypothetical protein